MKRLFALVPGVLVMSALLLNPGVEACGPVMPALHCPVDGLGKDYQSAGCPSGYCSRRVTLKSPALEYKGGKIYFCCSGCIDQFKKAPEKFAANANHQLVVSYQARQVHCPLCGGELTSAKKVDIGGLKVHVCGTECVKQLEKASPSERLQLVFGDAAFAKGFKMNVKAATPAPKTGAAATPTPTSAVAESGCCCCQPQAVTQNRDHSR